MADNSQFQRLNFVTSSIIIIFVENLHRMRTFTLTLLSLLIATTGLLCQAKDFVVVIDAGHGGSDPGALGVNATEKAVTLAVAKKLGKLVGEEKNVKVIYTRPSDRRVTLEERATIANKNKGDLFISIHTNSSQTNPETCCGTETYIIGPEKSDKNRDVVARENGGKYDPNSDDFILISLRQDLYLERSNYLATQIQKNMVSIAGRRNRGVKQDVFRVLWSVNMPSVLVELDFICNPEQEAFLASDDGQDLLAEAIHKAFMAYRKKYDKSNTKADKTDESYGDDNDNAPSSKNDKQGSDNLKTDKTSEKVTADKKHDKEERIANANIAENGGTYHIQILAADSKIPSNSWQFHGLKPVKFYKENGIYKYYYGSAASKSEIAAILPDVKKLFPKAFIIRLIDGKRVEFFL